MGNLSYKLLDSEQAAFEKWAKEHEGSCEYTSKTAANPAHPKYFTPTSPVEVAFRATGVGPVIHVRCLCGAEVDITDYEAF